MTRATLTHSILLCLFILMPLATLSIDDQAVETHQFDRDAHLISECLELSSTTKMDAYDYDSEENIYQSSIDKYPTRFKSSNQYPLRALPKNGKDKQVSGVERSWEISDEELMHKPKEGLEMKNNYYEKITHAQQPNDLSFVLLKEKYQDLANNRDKPMLKRMIENSIKSTLSTSSQSMSLPSSKSYIPENSKLSYQTKWTSATEEDLINVGLNYNGMEIGSLELELTCNTPDGMSLKTIIR